MMSVQQQARSLMSRHHQLIRNRSQSMLLRTVAEISVEADVTRYHSHIQGMTPNNLAQNYDRSPTAIDSILLLRLWLGTKLSPFFKLFSTTNNERFIV